MKLSEFAGYGDRMEQLMRSVRAGRIVHALLLLGPHGTGKKSAVMLFAQALVCSGSEKPCGICPECKRVLAGSHPDVHYLKPAGDKKLIGVDEVRDLIDAIGMESYEGGKHIVIAERADLLTVSAQNALLKTLENPVNETMFLLISETASALLSTILSRCQEVRFNPLSVEECAAVLVRKGIAEDRANMLSGLAQGSVGRALEIDADADYFALREKTLGALESLNGTASIAAVSAPLEETKGAESTILEIAELWARDLVAVQQGAIPFERDDEKRLKSSKLNGLALMKGIVRVKKRIASNVSWSYALEQLFFELAVGG